MSDVFIGSGDQIWDAGEYAATEPFGGDIPEETLDRVQPRCRGGREVHDETWIRFQPRLHDRMFVGGGVVDDQM